MHKQPMPMAEIEITWPDCLSHLCKTTPGLPLFNKSTHTVKKTF